MTEKSAVSINIDQETITKAVQDRVQQAIALELAKDPEEIIQALVGQALNVKVSETGNISKYSYENKFSLVEALFNRKIRAMSVEAVQGWLDENGPNIKRLIMKNLQANDDGIVKSLLDALISASTNIYRFKVEVVNPE